MCAWELPHQKCWRLPLDSPVRIRLPRRVRMEGRRAPQWRKRKTKHVAPDALVWPNLSLLQSRLLQHLQKLLLGPHINGLRHDLAFAVVDESLGSALDFKS